MKKLVYACMTLSIMLPLAAHATLSSDPDGIDGINGINIIGFEDNDVPVGGFPDFTGDVYGTDNNLLFHALFSFYEISGVDYLAIEIYGDDSSFIDYLDFSVTFTSLDWGPLPTEALTTIGLFSDIPDLGGAGLTPSAPDGHTLRLDFENLYVNESRLIDLKLNTEIDTGGGTNDPIPEPATMVLLGLGVAGLAARRKMG